MLTREDNALVTQVGPGTPMGALMRRFWVPALLSRQIPEPDAPPVRVRILGEQLVAFRDTNGRIGFVAENCPHRGASLFFGRNEEEGLRCVYHGWKFDTSGACVDMPNEPPESNFKHKVRVAAYPVREAGGLIWVYMGPAGTETAMPELEWLGLPSDYYYITKRYQRCNYLQNVEGELDSSHVSYLHSRIGGNAYDDVNKNKYDDPNKGQFPSYMATDKSPVFTIAETPYGFAVGARRNAEVDSYYWRITQFLMPSYTMIPAPVGGPVSFTGAVPVRDDYMVGFTVTWHPDRPLNRDEIGQIEMWTGIHTEVDPVTFQPLRNKDNDYLIDRQAQKTWSFTGIRGIREQDLAVQEGMGPIYDRSKERLGTSDTAIIAARRRILRALKDLEDGRLPYEVQDGSVYRIRSAALVLPRSVPFLEGAKEALVATA